MKKDASRCGEIFAAIADVALEVTSFVTARLSSSNGRASREGKMGVRLPTIIFRKLHISLRGYLSRYTLRYLPVFKRQTITIYRRYLPHRIGGGGRRYVLKFMSCGSRAGDNQLLSLGDYIEAALMLAYDERKVG